MIGEDVPKNHYCKIWTYGFNALVTVDNTKHKYSRALLDPARLSGTGAALVLAARGFRWLEGAQSPHRPLPSPRPAIRPSRQRASTRPFAHRPLCPLVFFPLLTILCNSSPRLRGCHKLDASALLALYRSSSFCSLAIILISILSSCKKLNSFKEICITWFNYMMDICMYKTSQEGRLLSLVSLYWRSIRICLYDCVFRCAKISSAYPGTSVHPSVGP